MPGAAVMAPARRRREFSPMLLTATDPSSAPLRYGSHPFPNVFTIRISSCQVSSGRTGDAVPITPPLWLACIRPAEFSRMPISSALSESSHWKMVRLPELGRDAMLKYPRICHGAVSDVGQSCWLYAARVPPATRSEFAPVRGRSVEIVGLPDVVSHVTPVSNPVS